MILHLPRLRLPIHSTLDLADTYAAIHPDEPGIALVAEALALGERCALVFSTDQAPLLVAGLTALANIEDDAHQATGDPTARRASDQLTALAQHIPDAVRHLGPYDRR